MNVQSEDAAAGSTRAVVRKQKLLDTARQLFIEHGFHATGIAQIAKVSGIAVGQIYRDFSSKEDIVAALVQSDCAEFLQIESLRAAMCAGDTDEVLGWLMRFIQGDDDLEGSRLFVEIVAESSRNKRIASIFVDIQRELRENLRSALLALAPRSAEHQRELLADIVMTMSLGIMHHRLMLAATDINAVTGGLRLILEERIEELRRRNG